jgi:hypothetical protein
MVHSDARGLIEPLAPQVQRTLWAVFSIPEDIEPLQMFGHATERSAIDHSSMQGRPGNNECGDRATRSGLNVPTTHWLKSYGLVKRSMCPPKPVFAWEGSRTFLTSAFTDV